MTVSTPDLDVPALTTWLAQVTGAAGVVDVSPIRGGASCEMFRVDRGADSWILRRAPLAAVADSAHQVVREAQIMAVLADSSVPVPEVLAICKDSSVLGAPFFVMARIDGEVVRRDGLPDCFLAHPETQPAIGEQLIDTLVALHGFEWRESPLADLSGATEFLPRQVDRWLFQLAGYRTRDLPEVDKVASWLTKNLPAGGDLTVMHGDYKIDNVIWSPRNPPRIQAVLDFEMTTIGDPLVDLAWSMIFWPEDGNLIALAAPGSRNGMSAEHTQAPGELVRRYAHSTGRDLSAFDWYQAFSAWKLAIVLEGSYAKFLSGESRNPTHEMFGFVVDQLLVRARRFAR